MWRILAKIMKGEMGGVGRAYRRRKRKRHQWRGIIGEILAKTMTIYVSAKWRSEKHRK
jgi:hypothetical protein